ncbi:unnamed protein product [Linum trigynum]|uniref:Uncharacterized protein n=1 Tax=Linum trigynum TaxID=586398 RepID=A0AAV2CXW4_9ROSI
MTMMKNTKGVVLFVMAVALLVTVSRTSLMAEATRYISPCVLNPNEPGCPGAPPSIGTPPSTPVPANPYDRGCLPINRCRPGNGGGDHA